MNVHNTNGSSEKILIPAGFSAAGAHIGAKKQKKDLSLIISDTPCAAAACYTQNTVKAAPVIRDARITEKGGAVRGIVTNSGCANACTGDQGMKDADEMARAFAELIPCDPDEVLVCSTGVIGAGLPMDVITPGIAETFKQTGREAENFISSAEAIMTTDTFCKTASAVCTIGGKKVTLFGMAKGSGMIHPNMATLLAYIITDCNITTGALSDVLGKCVRDTFNMISVDGDTSTNDTLILLANGRAENDRITDSGSDGYAAFENALFTVGKKLAVMIAKDGEGATKLLEVTVRAARTDEDARKLAKSVVSSSLVKSMFFGADANFGRIPCAMGYSGACFDPDKVNIDFKSAAGEISLMRSGAPVPVDEAEAKRVLSEDTIYVDIAINDGDFNATAWGCDLTYDYVKINGDYRT